MTDYSKFPHHDTGLQLSRRVYYTVTQKPDLEAHRIAKFTALLSETLVNKGLLSEEEFMSILDEVVVG
ncbi:hypothetical protein [Stutzerimonas nitrititolerans]|uniref:hypothetical protein n=1 Tax=Stutzerimonas nitrititolerans TaxID=2482751 RepID=UPI0028AFFF08|nr:hypothetical protein [Stutzerimonas nitrititolerans]